MLLDRNALLTLKDGFPDFFFFSFSYKVGFFVPKHTPPYGVWIQINFFTCIGEKIAKYYEQIEKMKRSINRKTTPKVKGGKPLKKNNHKLTPNYWNTSQKEVQIDEEKPGKGYKHFIKKRDILRFIKIIPNWEELSQGLDAIVLENGDTDYDGIYNNDGVIGISAWEKEQDILIDKDYYKEHKGLFNRLGIKSTKQKDGIFCEFNVDQIKAFQLLHILLHELGHHFDRIRTKSKVKSSRGEKYAEDFAYINEKEIWQKYQEEFNIIF